MNKYTNEEVLEFLKEHCNFDNPDHCYVIMGAARNKLNPGQDRERMTFKVLRRIESVQDKLDDIDRFMEGKNYYLYVSSNPRSSKKVTLELMKRCLDLVKTDDYSAMKNPFNLINKTFMHKSVKADRGVTRWDVDTQDESIIKDVIEYAGDNLVKERYTQNGIHLLVKPMDTRDIISKYGKDIVSVQPDAMLFINSYFN